MRARDRAINALPVRSLFAFLTFPLRFRQSVCNTIFGIQFSRRVVRRVIEARLTRVHKRVAHAEIDVLQVSGTK